MDTVIYDGDCKFCTRGIQSLRRLDISGRLQFTSLHDPSVAMNFPDLSFDMLMEKMWIISESGQRFGGADAARYLTTRLPLLFPLAPLLYLPGTKKMWAFLYRKVAENRYRLAGKNCNAGTCGLHIPIKAKV